MKIIALVQARMGSTRFPRKVMQPIAGIPMIEFLLARLARSRQINQIVLATSDSPNNGPLVEHVQRLGYPVFQGSEHDVLDRFYRAACLHKPDAIVRVTGDCPLIDPVLVDATCKLFRSAKVDYASNISPRNFPDGLDAEVFSFAALERACREAKSKSEREHVTLYLRESGLFKVASLEHSENLAAERWTVDEPADFEVLANIVEHFKPRRDFGWLEILALKRAHPELFAANRHLAKE